MTLSHADIRVMARAVGLELPDSDIADVAARTNALLQAVTDVENAFGARLSEHEPIPPVYPTNPFH